MKMMVTSVINEVNHEISYSIPKLKSQILIPLQGFISITSYLRFLHTKHYVAIIRPWLVNFWRFKYVIKVD